MKLNYALGIKKIIILLYSINMRRYIVVVVVGIGYYYYRSPLLMLFLFFYCCVVVCCCIIILLFCFLRISTRIKKFEYCIAASKRTISLFLSNSLVSLIAVRLLSEISIPSLK